MSSSRLTRGSKNLRYCKKLHIKLDTKPCRFPVPIGNTLGVQAENDDGIICTKVEILIL